MQQYAPKTAAQMLGIVDTYDEEGIMGVWTSPLKTVFGS
jgi:hypothetical protein